MKQDTKYLKLFVFIFFFSGFISAYILIAGDAVYDPNKTYDFVDHTQGAGTLVLGSGQKIFLWGVKLPDRGEPKYSEVSKFLTHTVAEQNISFLEMNKSDQIATSAKAFFSDGSDISQILIEQGLAKEDCDVTDGVYGTCNN